MRPQDRRTQVDGNPRRPSLRLELAAPSNRGSLWLRGLQGEVCERLRGGVEQGDEPRPLRPCLSSAEREMSAALQQAIAVGQGQTVSKLRSYAVGNMTRRRANPKLREASERHGTVVRHLGPRKARQRLAGVARK